MMRKSTLALAIVVGAAVFAATPAEAKSPKVVDPSTVTPTLNPDFAPWNCFEAGAGVTCQGSYRPEYQNEPIGLQCAGRDVLITGSGREFMTRWHTADGRATKTQVHLDYPSDRFSLSSDGTGPSLTVRGHFNRHYAYLVPGDKTSRVLTEVGAIYLVNAPGQGIVLHDTGSVTFKPGQDFEAIATIHGVHDVYEDPSAIDALICDALAG
jgi:hypothetical protein